MNEFSIKSTESDLTHAVVRPYHVQRIRKMTKPSLSYSPAPTIRKKAGATERKRGGEG